MPATPPGFFVAWFRPSEHSVWERTVAVTTQQEAFRRLAALGCYGTGAQHFVTRGRSPDEVFAALDAPRKDRAA